MSNKIIEYLIEPSKIYAGDTFKLRVKAIRYVTFDELKELTYNQVKNFTYGNLKGD